MVDLPATPGSIGIGGKVMVGPDNNVYVTIGDVGIDGHDTRHKMFKMAWTQMERVAYLELVRMVAQYSQEFWETNFL